MNEEKNKSIIFIAVGCFLLGAIFLINTLVFYKIESYIMAILNWIFCAIYFFHCYNFMKDYDFGDEDKS